RLVGKKSLDKTDIHDRGILWKDAPPRFFLSPRFMEEIDRGIGELQTFIQRAAALLPNRANHFIIDPGDSCVPILKGAHDLFQLEAAWEIIRERLATGQRFFTKYIEEFK
ncbi:hypothetical protein R3P38DRAFT_2397933, partial [Favolaschia claudopus]